MIIFSRECEKLLLQLKKMSPETFYHSIRVKKLTLAMLKLVNSREIQFDQSDIDRICKGALLHDIGKLYIPNSLLTKPSKLTAEEMDEMRRHTVYGGEALRNVLSNDEAPIILDICIRHHERVDPEKETQPQLPLYVQMVSICDAYDALVSDRVYHKGCAKETALDMIANGECGAFSSYLLDCLKTITVGKLS